MVASLTLAGCGSWNLAPARQEMAASPPEREAAQVEAPAEEAAREGKEMPEVGAASVAPAPPAEPSLSYRSDEVAGFGGDAAAGEAVTLMPAPTAGLMTAEAEAMTEAESDRAVESSVAAPQQVRLKAGEVDDNRQWDDYLLYRRNYQGPWVHDRDVSERYTVEVTDGQGNPVLGAEVRFYLPGQQRQEIYRAYTYANGQVLFHPLALTETPLEQVDRFEVEVQYENLTEQFSLTRFEAQAATAFSERWTVALDTRQQLETLNLDVLFLIDATGSMSDEINKVQSTIFDVAAKIDALPEQPEVRYGLVSYRDRGDSFVTQAYEFTPDVRDFAKNLNTVFADGGGDYPESLNEGLHQALNNVEWRGGGTVQLIFLVADAPPHLDYPQDYDYAVEMDRAAQRGIKIFPIASSGLDDQGEYIFRQLAQYTQGRFIFLTYAGPTNGGAPGETTTHHVDDYSVENLDELLVRLVTEELAHQRPHFDQTQ
jgi:hypothetical protein